MYRLLVTVVVLSSVLTVSSGDEKCASQNGRCQDDRIACPSGRYRSKLCDGGSHRRCCLPKTGDEKCFRDYGECQKDSKPCKGGYRSKRCGGGSERRCCLPKGDQKCELRGGNCQLTKNSCAGSYQSKLCSGANNRKCCLNNDRCTASGPGRLTNAEAFKIIKKHNIGWSSSGKCSNKCNKKCTSFTGMRKATLNGLVEFKKDLPNVCQVVITGGTEDGHSKGKYSHGKGYKIDLSLRACLYNYITKNYKYIGKRGDGAKQWQDPKGNKYALEGNHWDNTYF